MTTFKVSYDLCEGSTVSIDQPDNLTLYASGDLKDTCFSTTEYSSCSVVNGKITLVFEEAITTNNTIEVFVKKAVQLNSATVISNQGLRIDASWDSISIITDSVDTTAHHFTPAA